MSERKETDVALALTAQQKRQLAEMPPENQEVALRMLQLTAAVNDVAIKAAYNLGLLVERLTDDDQSVPQVAAFLNVDPNKLYAYRAVVKEFELETVLSWSSKPMASGNLMTTAHWIALARISGTEQRNRMLNRIIKESLSARDVEQLIKTGEFARRRNASAGAGRKPGVPSTLAGALQKFMLLHQTTVNFSPVMNESVFASIDSLTPDDVSPVLVTRLEVIDNLLAREVEALTNDRASVQRLLQKAKSCLAADTKDKEDAAEPAKGKKATKEPVKEPAKGKKATKEPVKEPAKAEKGAKEPAKGKKASKEPAKGKKGGKEPAKGKKGAKESELVGAAS